jgi:DNA repair protein RadC
VTAGLPELDLLSVVLGPQVAQKVAGAPGGWRTLHVRELTTLGLPERARRRIQALQELTSRGYPELERHLIASFEHVVRVYTPRLAGLRHEVVLGLALDGRNHLIEELELASGGRHGAALTPSDVFRPLVRVGASALIMIHNHPSGDPSPSPEDVHLTHAIASIGDLLGIPLLDHVVIGAGSGGAASMLDLNLIQKGELP